VKFATKPMRHYLPHLRKLQRV